MLFKLCCCKERLLQGAGPPSESPHPIYKAASSKCLSVPRPFTPFLPPFPLRSFCHHGCCSNLQQLPQLLCKNFCMACSAGGMRILKDEGCRMKDGAADSRIPGIALLSISNCIKFCPI